MHGESNIRRAAYHSNDDDIVFTKDGNLHIRTVWKDGVYGEGWYTSYLESSQSIHKEYESDPNYKGFSQTGGYFEIRCKVPYAKGIWSAFWLMPDNEIAFSENDVQWSGEDGLEIDIMESPNVYQKSKRAQNQNIHVIHADGYDERLKTIRSNSIHVPKMYDEFHTYSLLWDEDKYTFFIDGKKTWETKHIYETEIWEFVRYPNIYFSQLRLQVLLRTAKSMKARFATVKQANGKTFGAAILPITIRANPTISLLIM